MNEHDLNDIELSLLKEATTAFRGGIHVFGTSITGPFVRVGDKIFPRNVVGDFTPDELMDFQADAAEYLLALEHLEELGLYERDRDVSLPTPRGTLVLKRLRENPMLSSVTIPRAHEQQSRRVDSEIEHGKLAQEGLAPEACRGSRPGIALEIDLSRLVALYHGQAIPVTQRQAEILLQLLEAKGGFVASRDLKEFPDSGERPDRIIKSLREPLRKLIETKMGSGFRIPCPLE